MAKVCQVTGRKRMIGNNVAHSKLRTKREFSLNLKHKKFWLESRRMVSRMYSEMLRRKDLLTLFN